MEPPLDVNAGKYAMRTCGLLAPPGNRAAAVRRPRRRSQARAVDPQLLRAPGPLAGAATPRLRKRLPPRSGPAAAGRSRTARAHKARAEGRSAGRALAAPSAARRS